MLKIILTFVFLSGWAFGQDPHLDIHVADKLFRNGDLIGAKELVAKGLKSQAISDHLRANYLYINGLLLAKEADAEQEALEAFEAAVALYRKLDDDVPDYGYRVCRVGIINLDLLAGRIDQAEVLLTQFWEENQERMTFRERSYVLYLKARAAFLAGRYEDALALGRDCLQVNEEADYKRGIADAMVNLGRYLMLVGEWEQGYEMTRQAQEHIVALGDADKYSSSLLNEALYQRCLLGMTGDIPLQLVDARLRRVYDKELRQTRDAVLQLMCAP